MFSPVCTESGFTGQSQHCYSLASCGQCSGTICFDRNEIAEGVGRVVWLLRLNVQTVGISVQQPVDLVDDAAERGCRDTQKPIPTFASGGYLRGLRAVFSLKSTNFATRERRYQRWQFALPLHDECRAALDRRDTLLAAAQQDCTLSDDST
jgi:hypothetical protein